MRTLASVSLSVAVLTGCAEQNILARFRSVTVPPKGRVAVSRHLSEGKHHFAYETPGLVGFTMLSRRGVEDRSAPTWGSNGELYAPRPETYVFEFKNPTARPAFVIFPRDGANHGQITHAEAEEIISR